VVHMDEISEFDLVVQFGSTIKNNLFWRYRVAQLGGKVFGS